MKHTGSAEVGIKDVALFLAHQANELLDKSDPRKPFVALMTAAAVAGHIIQRDPKEMHEVLDKVMDLAEAALLEATETKQ
ncbi:hypothetical protein [Pukyongiella litopenaei]|uniref:Uncharacterized protein n=1 Tax=Pukyongiella litopenaei TaxID=2605946 RepID=A0A2S0ML62_9RHOB|nr:hypothetical protein [Pukyongiella litopenaei]AVO36624.1 hypothetical protein C6Y53_02195 [Pukyongiella litopenaei]